MKNLLFLLFSLSVLYSCQNENQSNEHVDYEKEYALLMGTNDSILTKEQRIKKKKLVTFFIENTFVINNKIVLDAKKDEFIKLNLPEEYYDLCIRDINSVNEFPDANARQELIDSFPIRKAELVEYLSKWKE